MSTSTKQKTITIDIKNYKSCRAKEGDAFSCTLYVDGKKAALVTYDGWGGAYHYDWSVAGPGHSFRGGPMAERVQAHVQSLPPIECEWMGDDGKPATLQPNMDILIGDLIDNMLLDKQLRSWCQKRVVLHVDGAPKGEFVQLNMTWPGNQAQVQEYLGKKYPGTKVEIINERFS